MTQTPPEAAEALEAVNQTDREAADRWIHETRQWPGQAERDSLVQAFARHRIAHTRAQPSREEAAIIPDGYIAIPIAPSDEEVETAIDQAGIVGCCTHDIQTMREAWAAIIMAAGYSGCTCGEIAGEDLNCPMHPGVTGSSAGEREIIERCARVADKAEQAAANEVYSYDSYGGPSLPGRAREVVRRDVAKGIATAIRALAQPAIKGERENG